MTRRDASRGAVAAAAPVGAVVVDARARFRRAQAHTLATAAPTVDVPADRCRVCGGLATRVSFPRVDHRRRGPWPRPYGTCDAHPEPATEMPVGDPR